MKRMRIGLNQVQKLLVFYSKHVLWNKPTIQASIDDINKKPKSLNAKME